MPVSGRIAFWALGRGRADTDHETETTRENDHTQRGAGVGNQALMMVARPFSVSAGSLASVLGLDLWIQRRGASPPAEK